MFEIETDRLRLRNWFEKDRELFHEINSDPAVMQFFPFRRTRAQSDELFERMKASIGSEGLGFYALALKAGDEAIGFCGLSHPGIAPILPEDTIEVGWRLATRHWGQGYVTEAARALLHFGFIERGFDEIVSFAVVENHRSTAVMQRIGMQRDTSADFIHPRVPETHPALQRHALYRITRKGWRDITERR